MTKTFKLSVIFFLSTLFLVVARTVFGLFELSDNINSWLFSFLVQMVGMGIIPLVLFKFWVKEDVGTGLGIKTKIPAVIYLLAILAGFIFRYLTIGISAIYQVIIRLLGFTHINSVSTIYSGPEVLIMDIICTAILPAIFEEITDRGIAMRMFDDVSSDRKKIVYMAILFALAHQNIVQTGYTFVGGLVISYFAIKTKSILPGMIIHFMNNFSSVISGYSRQKNGIIAYYEDILYEFINKNFMLAILSWIASAVLIVALLRYVRDIMKKNEKEKEIPAEPECFYTYTASGSNLQPLNDLFGFSTQANFVKTRSKWYEYAFLYGSVTIAFLTTIFSFIWGLWR